MRRTLTLALILLSSFALALALSVTASAQTESTLYTFNETAVFWPNGTLLEDAKGNFYGTTRGGGAYGMGTVFEFSPPAVVGGAWTFTTLYSFVPYGTGGWLPISDLVQDKNGAFYGTTYNGGDPVCNCGVVYKLTPPAVPGGAWKESQLYAFPYDNIHGRIPANAALALTSRGTLYGVTLQGGAWNEGVIYELQTKNGKTYTETDLYSFGDAADGNTPNGPIALDSAGNLYGVTLWGGAFNQGTVYKYTLATRTAPAAETILYSFGTSGSSDGANPSGNLIFDASGDIYGVTNSGGDSNGDGTVYTLSKSGTSYTESLLFSFDKNTTSGIAPVAGLAWNTTNNSLYGTTSQYGEVPANGAGTVFQLLPPATKGGVWTYDTLYSFAYGVVGGYPTGIVTRDPTTGNLFGTAQNGGIEGCDLYCGTIWEIANP
jgi:uncharacterized repeat protein (TIGR03803 family)